MTYIVPFEAEFCGEIRTIYSVNCDAPNSPLNSSVTTSEKCPHCKELNFYRFYEPISERTTDYGFVEIYDCKCASCRKKFQAKIEFEG
ncbi:hypothetical protein [Lysinibacillus fusiformis]|uniref:hypothetical protein n=1 Tax=Lysinibacillus fusiformis TaxID=28031 RepID=UPI0018802168|nr:hypothetical protein [Lysinibacillus fusiformis]MBD8521834.1 hypothetical protein [Lysinibacillus fusiformis]